MPLVTAIITTHKRDAAILERALKSILNQTHKNLEVFVVDDSPSDFAGREKVKETILKYADQNVHYIAHDVCLGACAARNTGLQFASGEFVGFLDDDDEWVPKKVESLIKGFTDNDIALVYCKQITFNDKTNSVETPETKIDTGYIFDSLIQENFIGSTSIPLIRTAHLREVGGFDPKQLSAQDFDVWLKLSKKYKVNFVDEPLVIYHIHNGEQISKNFSKRISGLEQINEKHALYLKENKNAFWIRNIKLVPFYAGNKQYKKAITTWFKAVAKFPFRIKQNLLFLISAIQYGFGKQFF